jgi:hypothetical protein
MSGKQSVIASVAEFKKAFPNVPADGDRVSALDQYFSIGGVIRAHNSDREWPKLTYPTYMVIQRKMVELKNNKKLYSERYSAWKKSYDSASKYHQTHQIKKLKEPLYWQHMTKMMTDSDYRNDANKVSLPAHLVSDPRWKPMVKMFVNDLEYRKQLTETVSTSIVYKKNKKVARYADELKEFRMSASNKQMEDLQKKIDHIEATEKALKELQKWVKE